MHIPSHLRFLVPGLVASGLVTARPGPRLVPSQHYQQRLVTFTSRFTSWNTSFLVNYRFVLALQTTERNRRNEHVRVFFSLIVINYYYYLGKIFLERLTKGRERKKGSGVGVPDDASLG